MDEHKATDQVRRMTPSDLDQVFEWRNDVSVRRHMYTQQEIELEAHRQWFERATVDPRKHLFIFECDGKPLGFISFNEIAEGKVADWGFYKAPRAPKHSGPALGCAALAHAFGELGLHKVRGEVLGENRASMKLHELLGFRREGVLREQHFDGERYHDVISYGLLAREWQNKT